MLLEPTNPLISVIIPTYNAGHFLSDAIASVRGQAYEPLEMIVVDDGSTDDTRSLMADWPEVRYLHQHNQGVSAARNTGIAATTSDLLAFLDVDDLWTPDHLRLLLPHLLADPELQFVWGSSNYVRLAEDPAGVRTHTTLRENVPLFLIGSGLYRRSVFSEVGPFDPSLELGEDAEWLAKARHLKTAQKPIADAVLIYRSARGA